MKKLLAILCAAMLLVACCIPVLAAGDGSITINNSIVGQTYSAYQMAVLESASGTSYSYKVVSGWEAFFGEYSDVFKVEDGYITYQTGMSQDNITDKAAFAKAALKYAADNEIDATKTVVAADADPNAKITVTEISGLELGYYLVDSTAGTICGLGTTNKNVVINDKNPEPTIDKTVENETAEIGEVLNFTITITKEAGAINYVLHDTMTKGLDFSGTVTITTTIDGVTTSFSGYDLIDDPGDSCTFEVKFHNDALAAMKDGTVITIAYSATLTEEAFIAGEGTNKNEAELKYGENSDLSTTKPVVTVYTYKFDLVKTDADKKLLAGAIFELYDSSDALVGLTKVDDHTYIVDPSGTDKITTVDDGYITIKGLAAEKYHLKEVEAPAGYNKLTSDVSVDLSGSANITTNMTGTTWVDGNGGIQITNNTGAVLPETGGFGTTMFILIGGGLMLCTGILLVTKKRMEKIAD